MVGGTSSGAPLAERFPFVKKFKSQPATNNCTATCIRNAIVALAEKTGSSDIRKISIKEINKTIRLKKDLVLNTKYIVPAFNTHFRNKGLLAYIKSGAKITERDLREVLQKQNASPPIVNVPARFFEIYGVEVGPDPIIGGGPFQFTHDVIVLGIDDVVWFHDPLSERPNLSIAHQNPDGQIDTALFLDLWASTKEPNTLIWIEKVPPGPIDPYLTGGR